MAIPKTIYSIWLNASPVRPPLVERCLATQHLPGYEHRVVGLNSSEWHMAREESRYLRECGPTGNWVKASDYLRMWLLHRYGGIFLDADMAVLPGKDFDDLLDCRMWVPYEFRGFLGNSGLASEAGHPTLERYLKMVDDNFHGEGDMIFQIGMTFFNDVLYMADKEALGIRLLSTDYFFPYCHFTGETNVTANTRVYHHYMKSWKAPVGLGA